MLKYVCMFYSESQRMELAIIPVFMSKANTYVKLEVREAILFHYLT